jgi:hypothetical protein
MKRLVKTGNPSACVTVKWRLFKSAIALYLSMIKKELVTKVLINPIIRTRTRYFRHAYHPTCDNIIRTIKSRSMKCTEHVVVVSVEERRDAYRILVGKPKGTPPFGR